MSSDRRIPATDESNPEKKREASANEALSLMRKALELIDRNDGPVDVGAHLDLAIHRLQKSTERDDDRIG
ncbi:MAG: hypothetical protein M3Q19_12795 [Pseudomonadota bacterium]|nr:hypothetical protein [Pseudomonadota bacterium]